MMSRFSALTSSSKKNNSEKIGESYERDSARLQRTNPAARSNPHDRYAGSFAPNPAFIKFIRFFLYAITSMSALATAGVGLGVAHYYNTHKPVVVPSWGSLIACIVFGIATPGVLFGMFLVTPKLFRHGGVGASLNQTRYVLIESKSCSLTKLTFVKSQIGVGDAVQSLGHLDFRFYRSRL